MTNHPDMVAVIMAGGTGTRFWPLSTNKKPKQFLRLFGDKSLLQMSFERARGLVPPDRILALTSQSFGALVRKQLPEIPPENVIGEPMRKDTAGAVGLASYLVRHRFGDPVMCVLTSDHLIDPLREFHASLLSAARVAARDDSLYTFGIVPDCPSTAYGYLECGGKVLDDGGIPHHLVRSFKEKPDLATARSYLERGGYFWNSGMFVWRTDSIIRRFEDLLPAHARLLSPLPELFGGPAWGEALREAFQSLDPVSIDLGVMERAENVRCVKGAFRWRDVGGWGALLSHMEKDGAGNAGRGEVLATDSSGNLVFCEDPAETVALVGVSGLIVVRSGKKTLVLDAARAEDLKDFVESMEDDGE